MSKNNWDYKCEPEPLEHHRYALICKYKNSESKKSATIVMLNPSKANSNGLDPTMGIVLNKMKNLDYAKVIILNLFAYIEPKPEKLQEKINVRLEEAIGEENDSYLEQYLNSSNIIILAWGNAKKIDKTKLKERIQNIFNKMNTETYIIGKLTNHNQPKHGRSWRKVDQLNPISIGDIV